MHRTPRPARRRRHLPLVVAVVLPLLLSGCNLLFRAELTVTPSALEFPATTSVRSIQVLNAGAQGSLLHWEATGTSRLSVWPARGTLRAGEAAEVWLSVDRTDMTEGLLLSAVVRGAGREVEVQAIVDPAVTVGPASCDPEPLVRYAGVATLPIEAAAAAFAAAGIEPSGVIVRWGHAAGIDALDASRVADALPADAAALVSRSVPFAGGAWLATPNPVALARRLASEPNVLWVELDGPVVRPHVAVSALPNDAYYVSGDQWWLDGFGYAAGRLGPGDVAADDVVVAVIDTGIATEHEDLAGVVLPGRSFLGNAWSTDVEDTEGHGTHVSGLLAAAENNGVGLAGIAAHAEVRVLPIKMFGPNGTGGLISDLVTALRWAAGLEVTHPDGTTLANEVRVDVINMSLGTGIPYASLQVAVIDARCEGVLLVASAGNDGRDGDVGYPARYPEVLSVGSVDQDMARSSFSDFGEGMIDLMAPGGRAIPATAACSDGLVSSYVGGGYACLFGTSMAAPLVAGSAALLVAAEPGAYRGDPGSLEDALRAAAARNLPQGASSAQYGAGVLCLDALLTASSVCGVANTP